MLSDTGRTAGHWIVRTAAQATWLASRAWICPASFGAPPLAQPPPGKGGGLIHLKLSGERTGFLAPFGELPR